MLDTDTASYIIRGTVPAIDQRLLRLDVRRVCISAVTRGELRFGTARLPNARRLAERFLSGLHALPWDEATADHYGKLRAALERKGAPIGNLDTMIAAHALAVDAVLVTSNVKHFSRVAGLTVENWAVSH